MNTPTIISEAPAPSPASLQHVQRAATVLSQKKFDRENITSWALAYIGDPNKQRRIAFDLDYVSRHTTKNATIVEYGAIPLVLTLAMQFAGYRATGIDIAPERFHSIIDELGLDVVRCDIEREKAPFPDDSCDLVVFNELFEHLRINLIFTMQEVFRILKPNGKLLLSSPNLRSLNGLINFLLHQRSYSCCGKIYEEYQKIDNIGHMGHVREYTPVELSDFLHRIGFTIETIIFRGAYRERWKRRVAKLWPRLRPFMSIVATKPLAGRS